jgi:hypothetical protein
MNYASIKPSAGGETRRSFIKKTASTAAVAAGAKLFPMSVFAENNDHVLAIVVDATDPLLKEPPVLWAVEQLRDALRAKGVTSSLQESFDAKSAAGERILVARSSSTPGRQVLENVGASVPGVPEALGLVRGKSENRPVLLACGSDARGQVYALLELADRVRLAGDPLAALREVRHTVERPANVVRSVARFFVSDVEDKPWFYDREFWGRYLTMLTAQRFNRFSLTLGIGYDFTSNIRDCYFHFAYPFLVSVPGYAVRAVPLPDAERERNLELLRFISDETARRGLHFQLGLWTHGYHWTNSPHANYTIEGLTAETHGAYCRDALRQLLTACPAINGVTFRVHGESGVAEANYAFWQTVFDGIVQCGRRVEIDMHAKGMDQAMIDVALATGMPVNVSPKYWAEHMGLPYMQAAIRPLEMPPRESRDTGFFSKSSGSRRFLRYGYGDLLAENRRYGVLHRIWPGTQRLLLWGDPALAAGYGRASSFCGSVGVEWCEPLSFKGRKGSGLPGGRLAYADASLRPAGGDFEKYLYTYRVWGRCVYNPDCDAEGWRRALRAPFGAATQAAEGALANASGILPLVTTAHCPSAANNNYWPELYTNMPIVNAARPHPYGDTLSPKRFGTVSSLDPELFSRIDDFADELLKGERSGKYSPVWVAAQLEDAAAKAESFLRFARSKTRDAARPEFRRLAVDVAIQSGLGRFFALKFRAGVLYAIYDRSGHRPALERAIQTYRQARAAWVELAEHGKDVYASDITFGYDAHLRGHWLDRLPAIDLDIADMESILEVTPGSSEKPLRVERAVAERAVRTVVEEPQRPPRFELAGIHSPPAAFERGKPLTLEVSLAHTKNVPKLASLRLHYRRVNQAEVWQVQPMNLTSSSYRAVIPAEYTDSAFPLQYYFELRGTDGAAWLHPGLSPEWRHQPYYVVRRA